MSISISPLSLPPAIPDTKPAGGAGQTPGAGNGFQHALTDAIQKVEDFRTQAESDVSQLLSGQREDLHNVALSTQKAEMSFELFLQTRNKVVQAYQEIMRMQV